MGLTPVSTWDLGVAGGSFPALDPCEEFGSGSTVRASFNNLDVQEENADGSDDPRR